MTVTRDNGRANQTDWLGLQSCSIGLTRKLINSDTHSCTHSLASLAIFAFDGRAFFMILPTFAIWALRVGQAHLLVIRRARDQRLLTGRYRSCSLNSSNCASVKVFGSPGATSSAVPPMGARTDPLLFAAPDVPALPIGVLLLVLFPFCFWACM